MYYYRDSYVDQQIAYGVARSVQIRRFGRQSPREKALNSLTQVFCAFLFLAMTFTVTYMVLDVLGFESLTTFYAGDRLTAILGLDASVFTSL